MSSQAGMKFCSQCGDRVALQLVGLEQRQRYVCISCATVHYQNQSIIVGCAVCCGGRVLMCRRAEEPDKGKWSVPSGFLEQGETLQEGASREVLEETGVRVDPAALELYAVINMTRINQVGVTFRVVLRREPAEIRCGPECMEAAFVAPLHIALEDYAWLDALGDMRSPWSEQLSTGEFGIRLISIGTDRSMGARVREYHVSSVSDTEWGTAAELSCR